MKYVDTNIILRVILRDNEELSPLAREILKTNECYVLPEVIPEAVYVLNKVYKFNRKDIANALLQLLPLVVVKDVRLTRLALNYFAELDFDYVDCILLARNKLYGHQVATLDKKLEKAIATLPPVSLY